MPHGAVGDKEVTDRLISAGGIVIVNDTGIVTGELAPAFEDMVIVAP
jgi:hypothetical protein